MGKFRTLELAKEFYRLGQAVRLPLHLVSQFQRSSASVALNLAEGNAKLSNREKFRFYEIAHGSFREAVTILELENISAPALFETADQLGACLFKLTRAMAKKIAEERTGRGNSESRIRN